MAKKEPNSKRGSSRANSMLSVWFGILFGSLQAFLIVQNVRSFVWFAELSWPYQKTPYLELNSYIILTGVSVLLLPFFLAASILQVGNTANDGRLLGKHLNFRDEWAPVLVPSMLYQRTKDFFQMVWTHSGPTSSLVHIISSFCLLLPQTLMEAVLLKFGYISNEKLWHSDLDVLIPQVDRNSILKILGGNESGKLAGNGSTGFGLMDTSPGTIRLAYLNYALALTIFSIRYASVFWHSNKGFATVFSIQLLINTLHGLISYSAFTVLYKVHVLGSLRVLRESMPVLLNPYTILLLHLVSSILLLGSSSVLYQYGYMRVAAFVQLKARTTCITGPRQDYSRFRAYFPHCSALGIFLALAASQSPIVHDAQILYNKTLDNTLLALVISAGTHLVIWIILWIALSFKRDWTFNVNVTLGNVCVKGLEGLKLVAEMSLDDPSTNVPKNSLSDSMLVISSGKVFTVGDISSQREILGFVQGASSPTPALESDGERVYWPRPCPPAQTSNSLSDDIQPWLREATESVTRNKVTFYDDQGSSRKFSSVPLVRGGVVKRSFRDKNYSELSQEIDDGDYAVLKRGKGCLKPQLSMRDPNHPEFLMPHQYGRTTHSTLPGGHKYETHYQTQSGVRGDGRMPLDTPHSVLSQDSGYPGTAERGSRSVSSTGSPPDRSVPSDSSSGVLSSSTFTGGPRVQSTDCCTQECCPGDAYGKLSLLRRQESLRSAVSPNYQGSHHGKNPDGIYQSRIRPQSQMMENQYGETPRRGNESSAIVPKALNSPPYFPAESQYVRYTNQMSPSPAGAKYTNINTANEMEEQRQVAITSQDLYGRVGTPSRVSSDASLIKSTPYGRCTNMRLSSFAEDESSGPPSNSKVPLPQVSSASTFVPPIPPPLPSLSLHSLQCLQGIPGNRLSNHSSIPNGSPRGSYRHQ